MRQINEIAVRPGLSDKTTSQTRSQTTSEQQTSDFTQHERDSTAYVFFRFRAMYPAEFSLLWPTEKELAITKRTYAREIGKYTRAQIDEALGYIVKMATEGEKEYLRPSVLVFLRVIGQLNTNRAMYRVALPAPAETKVERQQRRQVGMEKCGELLKIFD